MLLHLLDYPECTIFFPWLSVAKFVQFDDRFKEPTLASSYLSLIPTNLVRPYPHANLFRTAIFIVHSVNTKCLLIYIHTKMILFLSIKL